MTKRTPQFYRVLTVSRRNWLLLTCVLFAVLLWWAKAPVQAAPLAQTVPTPTDEPTSTPPPPATNTPKPKDKDDDDDKAEPTATPVPAAPQPAPPSTDQGLTGVVIAGSRLNMREGPGTNFAIIGGVSRDEVVKILERNEQGTWWRICCSTSTTTEGWASAQFIQPNFDPAQANQLIPLLAGEVAVAPAAPAAANLSLTLAQFPQFVWQGQTLSLRLVVANSGTADATNVEVRSELPGALTFVAADPGAGGQWEQQSGNAGSVAISLRWPTLAAGQSATATLQVQVAKDLADGSVIDNLAVLNADGLAAVTEGISIGMPPVTLPDFQ